jgi:3-dehydroquinate synthase
MTQIERKINVSYMLRVFFTRGVFDPANPLLGQLLAGNESGCSALTVLDESLAAARPQLVSQIQNYFVSPQSTTRLVCAPMIIEGGERAKNSYFHVSEIQSQIERYHVDRHSYVIAIGGGALLDMAGLAAATAHRGVRLVRIPTTTLAQADSGVGVKNGINAFGKKNFIGTFAPPFAVVNDFAFLDSLEARDKRGGYAEAVKVALIRNARFFEEIESRCEKLGAFDPASMEWIIQRCAELHLDHIAESGDPFEFGTARPLDFGHWAAHKLEQLSEYKIRHGEAVAMGLAMDVLYSKLMGFITAADCERVLRLLEGLGFELFANELLHEDSAHQLLLLNGLAEFREHLGGKLCITLLRGIGCGFETDEMHPAKVMEAIRILQQRHQSQSRIIRSEAL